MFLLVPLILIFLSAIGIGIIVFRKFPYLQKLTPESHEVGPSLFYDFFPEVVDGYRSIKFSDYKDRSLAELEKLLRRIRLLIVSIDRLSSSMINKLRRVQKESAAAQPVVEVKTEEIAEPQITKQRRVGIPFMSAEQLKQEEQNLIVSIAQDPKNQALYVSLGDVYVRLKNYEDAKESYQMALRLDPESQKVQDKLSLVIKKLSS